MCFEMVLSNFGVWGYFGGPVTKKNPHQASTITRIKYGRVHESEIFKLKKYRLLEF